jgi:hypothetical protein
MLYTAHLAQVAFLGEPLIVIKIKGHYCLVSHLIGLPLYPYILCLVSHLNEKNIQRFYSEQLLFFAYLFQHKALTKCI